MVIVKRRIWDVFFWRFQREESVVFWGNPFFFSSSLFQFPNQKQTIDIRNTTILTSKGRDSNTQKSVNQQVKNQNRKPKVVVNLFLFCLLFYFPIYIYQKNIKITI
ncbi:hypothetical protein ES332_A11G179200v1 [Gossypium tomentosum]|uniref:Uncharacterized protein n=1 Tax=Gossypium tomentosum TaxID=34277 RepID=A0A5D2NCQ1_GOSTO|nr:hypothetical protein ES332_A11G179200v1 [Gossypium tomentosum]